MAHAHQTIEQLTRNMDEDELIAVNKRIIKRIKALRVKIARKNRDTMKIGQRYTFKNRNNLYNVGTLVSFARSTAILRVSNKKFKCYIHTLEPTDKPETTNQSYETMRTGTTYFVQ